MSDAMLKVSTSRSLRCGGNVGPFIYEDEAHERQVMQNASIRSRTSPLARRARQMGRPQYYPSVADAAASMQQPDPTVTATRDSATRRRTDLNRLCTCGGSRGRCDHAIRANFPYAVA